MRWRPQISVFSIGLTLIAASCSGESGQPEAQATPSEKSTTQTTQGLDDEGAGEPSVEISAPVAYYEEHVRFEGQLSVEVLNELVHDTTSFTQGLEVHEGRLLESQGRWGESGRSWINTSTGAVEGRVELADSGHFAEGITVVGEEFVQLTYQAGVLLRGSLDDLQPVSPSTTYGGEGWGLCFDGTRLIKSDGSATLTFHDPSSFDQIGAVKVTDENGEAVELINELECVGDQVMANIWGLDTIVVIDPGTGNIDAELDMSELRPPGVPLELSYALNGIAYDEPTDTFFLTGKLWPVIYHVTIANS